MQRFIAIIFLGLLASACVSTRSSHGYIMELGEKEVTADVGVDTKESVLARYGEPSVRPALNDNTWYYINSRAYTRAYKAKQTNVRNITAILFDNSGSVTGIETYTKDDEIELALVERKTRSRGKELTFWEQLLGSIGQLPTTTEETP